MNEMGFGTHPLIVFLIGMTLSLLSQIDLRHDMIDKVKCFSVNNNVIPSC